MCLPMRALQDMLAQLRRQMDLHEDLLELQSDSNEDTAAVLTAILQSVTASYTLQQGMDQRVR